MFNTAFLDLPPLAHAAGEVTLPGSKSISNRVLLLAALCDGTTTVHDLLDSDDTRVMLQALKQLGCAVTPLGDNTWQITGLAAQLPVNHAALFMGNAGTAMRPLTAALSLLTAVHGGLFDLSGVPRMHERPIGDLVEALQQLGCPVSYTGQAGYPPLQIGNGQPARLKLDEPIRVRGDVSSQFLTALLLALPLVASSHVPKCLQVPPSADGSGPGSATGQDIHIDVVGELISKPYIDITLNLLARFGVVVQRQGWQRFTIPAGSRYQSPGHIHVEADASSASYFIALGAIASGVEGKPSGITIHGVGADSIQGDIRFADAAALMGARITSGPNWLRIDRGSWPLKAITLDCNHIPDAAMTLATMALYAEGTTTLTNIASWRVKETDRIAAMACELRKLGATVQEGPDWISVAPPAPGGWKPASIHTYDDHRVAMCFSLAAFNADQVPVRIEDPKCVAKTFPDYFECLFSVAEAVAGTVPVICIDGPTASGKGTLASEVAARLGYHVLDSGVLYRLVGLSALRAGVSLAPHDVARSEHAVQLTALAAGMKVGFAGGRVWLAGEDVTDAVRAESAGMAASAVSAIAGVREALLALQHRSCQLPGLVADGRDMGTVIFPTSPLKIFLTASAETRAQRRFNQLIGRGQPAIIEDLLRALKARDEQDISRPHAPLKPAEDALLLDNSDQTIDESVAQVLAWWQSKQAF